MKNKRTLQVQGPFCLFFFWVLRLIFYEFVVKPISIANSDTPGDCRYRKKYCSNKGNHAENLGEIVRVEPVKQKSTAQNNNYHPNLVNNNFDNGNLEAAFCV